MYLVVKDRIVISRLQITFEITVVTIFFRTCLTLSNSSADQGLLNIYHVC